MNSIFLYGASLAEKEERIAKEKQQGTYKEKVSTAPSVRHVCLCACKRAFRRMELPSARRHAHVEERRLWSGVPCRALGLAQADTEQADTEQLCLRRRIFST